MVTRDSDRARAEIIKERLKAMYGAGNSAEDLSTIFNLSLASVRWAVGVPTPPTTEPELTGRMRNRLSRRRGR